MLSGSFIVSHPAEVFFDETNGFINLVTEVFEFRVTVGGGKEVVDFAEDLFAVQSHILSTPRESRRDAAVISERIFLMRRPRERSRLTSSM